MILYRDTLRALDFYNINFILAPASPYLPLFKNEPLSLAAQDIPLEENLKLTGDITIEQLKSLNVSYTLIGHYERRKYYHEKEQDIIAKIKNALTKGLKVIYCIGESFEERARHVEYQIIEREIARVFNNLREEDLKNIIIAYEPTYMIGKNIAIEPKVIENTINFIKNLTREYYHCNIDIVYGGSVNSVNIEELKALKNLDGIIIGASSTNVIEIKNILKEMN